MRVFFALGHGGHARNFESAIRLLAERGHDVVVAVDSIEGHEEPLRSLAAAHRDRLRVVVLRMPAWHPLSAPGVALRALEDYLRYLDPPYADADAVRERAAASAWLGRGRRGARRLLERPALRRRARLSLRAVERRLPARPRVTSVLGAERPEVLVATPLVDLRSRQVEWFRAAQRAGIPTLFPVASWDNLTVKGTLHHSPDLVTVWNDDQRREAVELHGVDPERIRVTGAVAYDHWFGWGPSASRDEMCARLGLAANRPYVLYMCSAPFVAPREVAFVLEWARQLEGVQIVMRPHPSVQPVAADRAALASAGVKVFPENATNPVDRPTRTDYFDSIYHSAAVVGVNTSGFIESAIIGRPGFTLMSERYRDTQPGLRHFAYLLQENGGPVRAARSFPEHQRQLMGALQGDDDRSAELDAFVRRFVRPFGLEEAAAPRLVDAIESLAG